jgi:predicted DsbA family dithiol-disulfide isomerase
MSLETSPLLIEVWSDVVCPWCYIGKRNLEAALINFVGKEKVEIKHRAFRLDPLAHGIRPTLTVLGEKYAGGTAQVLAMIDRVSKVASDAGLKFRLAETQTGNTLDAHRLLLWAQSEGNAQPLLAAMYRAYFEDARPLFDHETLLLIAIEAGYPEGGVKSILASDDFANAVEEDQTVAGSLGANGVPFFVIDRKYGLSGAQPVDSFAQVLVKASA